MVELVAALSIGLLVWWAAQRSLGMSAQEANSLAGVVTAFILCINLLFRPLRMIADKFNVLQMGMIASERVFKVLDNPDELKQTGGIRDTILLGQLEFRDVWHAYNPDLYVFFLIFLVSFVLFYSALNSTHPLGLDSLGHLSKIKYMQSFPGASWNYVWYSGGPLFQYYPPLFYYIIYFFKLKNNLLFNFCMIINNFSSIFG